MISICIDRNNADHLGCYGMSSNDADNSIADDARRNAAASTSSRRRHAVAVCLLLLAAGVPVTLSLREDSVTFDETAHLVAGFSYLHAGDFRLQPEHPPFPKTLAALPLTWMDHRWPEPDAENWRTGDYWKIGRTWLFAAADGERLAAAARYVMVGLLLGTCLVVYALARGLFGPSAGLLALTLAALCPSWIAHGRFVTNDVAAAGVIALTLLAYAHALTRPMPARLALAALATAVLPLTKFCWLLALPALLFMAIVALFGGKISNRTETNMLQRQPAGGRLRRSLIIAALIPAAVLIAWLSIWTCYGWTYSGFRGADRDVAMYAARPNVAQPKPGTLAAAWETVLQDQDGRPLRGLLPEAIRFARDRRLLPEAYLYGLAHTVNFTATPKPAYLNGRIYLGGRAAYFPTTFALKTPLPTLILLLAGLAAVLCRKVRVTRNSILLTGVIVFVVLFAFAAVTGEINFGERHILPLYPALFSLAGAAAAWAGRRVGQAALVLLLLWLVWANVTAYPNYLAYFNELAGGPPGGCKHLADSNIDWGQNLKRLARYAETHPDEQIKLAYFGSADPTRYGFKCEPLPSFFSFGRPGELGAGSYVVSANLLLGLCEPAARDGYWDDQGVVRQYRFLHQQYLRIAAGMPPSAPGVMSDNDVSRYGQLRWGLFLWRLRQRTPDERVGQNLFVYRLSSEDIAQLIAPLLTQWELDAGREGH